MSATLTINLDPNLHLGSLEIAWHGLMAAVGIGVGAWLASRFASERGLDTEPLFSLVYVIVVAGVVGAKLLFVAQNDFQGLLSANGYSVYGGLVGGGVAAAGYVEARGLSLRYLDALAAGLPLGLAVGRVGDLINGEHFGPPSDLPWAIVYSHPDSLTPDPAVAYHPGGLHEVVLSLAIFAAVWPERASFRRPTVLLWTTLALYGAGRFVMFFWRDDASMGLAGLNSAQLESLLLVAVALTGAILAKRLPTTRRPGDQL